MKINHFAVNNFRGISGGLDKNKIIFKDTNTLFLFGQNNTGKSTFLRAYIFFYDNIKPSINDHFRQNKDLPIEFEIEFLLDSYDLENIAAAAPKKKDSFKKYLKNGTTLLIKKEFNNNDKIDKTWNPNTKEWDKTSYGTVGLPQVFQSCMPTPIFIKAMPTEEEAKNKLNEVLKILAESQLNAEDSEALKLAKATIGKLQDQMYNKETIDKYEKSVNEYFNQLFPDTNIKIKEGKNRLVLSENKFGKEFEILYNKVDSSGKIDEDIPTAYRSIGHGTIRITIFTLLILKDIAEEFERKEGRKDYIVLFEEPELFLYPKIIKDLRNLIYKVSDDKLPYQVLCASHSPQMIDISKPKSSIIRLVKSNIGTEIHQINDAFLKEAKDIKTDEQLKQEMYEVLRFNPYICEAFYSDEVILVEGPTEEILIRAYLQEQTYLKDIFVLNCGTVNNIPFYQKVFSKFGIRYNVICDTDKQDINGTDNDGNPIFNSHIQGSISTQFQSDKISNKTASIFRVHKPTFEPAHTNNNIPENLRFEKDPSESSKPFNANKYWKDKLFPNLADENIIKVPIIKFINEIITN